MVEKNFIKTLYSVGEIQNSMWLNYKSDITHIWIKQFNQINIYADDVKAKAYVTNQGNWPYGTESSFWIWYSLI